NLAERSVGDTGSGNHRDTQCTCATQQRRIQRVVGGAERNAYKDPAHRGAWYRFAARSRPLDALADTVELPFVGKIHHEASDLLLLPLRTAQIEHVVAVEILLVQTSVADSAIGARVADLVERTILVPADREFGDDAGRRELPW